MTASHEGTDDLRRSHNAAVEAQRQLLARMRAAEVAAVADAEAEDELESTVLSARRTEIVVDEDLESTVLGSRRTASVNDEDLEATVLGSRKVNAFADEEGLEATILSSRRSANTADADLEATVLGSRRHKHEDASDIEATVLGSRKLAAHVDQDANEDTLLGSRAGQAAEAPLDATVVAPKRRTPASSPSPDAANRLSYIPEGVDARERYVPRRELPVQDIRRSVPQAQPQQRPADGARALGQQRKRASRRFRTLLVAASLFVVVIVAAIVVLSII